VKNGKKSSAEINRYISDLSQDSQNKITQVYNSHFDGLVNMNRMYHMAQEAMENAIADYPENVKSDLRKVVAHPDAMSLLTENIDLTMSLGEDYHSQPDSLEAQLRSINSQLATQDASLLADYKAKVENDPALQGEMKQASDNFSSTYGADSTAQNMAPAP